MLEQLSKIDYLNVIENNQIVEPQLWRTSLMVRNSDYQSFGLDMEPTVKSVLSNEIMVDLTKHITNKLFESAEVLEDYDIESEASDMADVYSGGKYIHKIQTDYYNKIFDHLLKLDGEFKFLITNANLMANIMDFIDFKVFNPHVENRITNAGAPYQMGSIYDITLFVNPHMGWNDNRILFGSEKVNVEANGNLNFQGLEQIEEFKIKEEDKIEDPIDHSDVDPFGEENWMAKTKLITQDFRVSSTYKFKFSFDETKFQKIKIIDKNGILI